MSEVSFLHILLHARSILPAYMNIKGNMSAHYSSLVNLCQSYVSNGSKTSQTGLHIYIHCVYVITECIYAKDPLIILRLKCWAQLFKKLLVSKIFSQGCMLYVTPKIKCATTFLQKKVKSLSSFPQNNTLCFCIHKSEKVTSHFLMKSI